MESSSDSKATIFAGLRLKQILVMLQILDDAKYKTREYIQRRYLEQAQNFEATLDFLTELSAIQVRGEELTLSKLLAGKSTKKDMDNVRRLVIDLIVRCKNRYSSEAFAYLSLFKVTSEGKATYKPSDDERSEQSAVRNFMMDLEIVSFDETTQSYMITPGHSATFAAAICGPFTTLSVERLREIKRGQEEIGFAAELEIVSFECKRIGPEYASEVEHIAERNSAAGYDVRSITIDEDGVVSPRYIEVKAVPTRTLQFFWTENEQKVAEAFSSWYYLYLLPVGKGGTFLIEDLRIIGNPHSSVLNSPDEWIIENNVTRCYLNPEDDTIEHIDV